MADVESSAKNVVEVSIEDDAEVKEVAVRSFDPQTYRRQQAWLIVLQVNKVLNPLRTVSHKYENDFLEFPQAKKIRAVLS